MADNSSNKILVIIAYLIIIVLLVLFLDYLFKITVRRNRKNKIMDLAKKKSFETNKPIVAFNDMNDGVVIDLDGRKESFSGNIRDISDMMADNSCVLVVSETLEYLNTEEKSLNDIVEQLVSISGGDLYCSNIETGSPRVLWDYNIKNIMDKSYYVPGDNINWTKPNDLQMQIQKFYNQLFKILPYNFFAKDPIIKI